MMGVSITIIHSSILHSSKLDNNSDDNDDDNDDDDNFPRPTWLNALYNSIKWLKMNKIHSQVIKITHDNKSAERTHI